MSAIAKEMKGVPFSEMVYYDPTSITGLRHKTDKTFGNGNTLFAARVGDIAGSERYGYWIYTTSKYGTYACHRIIYLLENKLEDLPIDFVVDHIDGNPLNNVITNLRLIPKGLNSRNSKMYSTNTSDKTGIYRDRKSEENVYWKAAWMSRDGKLRTKSFSIKKYGEDEAHRLASEFRDRMIDELNVAGADYTERHGTVSNLEHIS